VEYEVIKEMAKQMDDLAGLIETTGIPAEAIIDVQVEIVKWRNVLQKELDEWPVF